MAVQSAQRLRRLLPMAALIIDGWEPRRSRGGLEVLIDLNPVTPLLVGRSAIGLFDEDHPFGVTMAWPGLASVLEVSVIGSPCVCDCEVEVRPGGR